MEIHEPAGYFIRKYNDDVSQKIATELIHLKHICTFPKRICGPMHILSTVSVVLAEGSSSVLSRIFFLYIYIHFTILRFTILGRFIKITIIDDQ